MYIIAQTAADGKWQQFARFGPQRLHGLAWRKPRRKQQPLGVAYVRYILGVLAIFAIRALAIKYHLGVPVLSGHAHRAPHHRK